MLPSDRDRPRKDFLNRQTVIQALKSAYRSDMSHSHDQAHFNNLDTLLESVGSVEVPMQPKAPPSPWFDPSSPEIAKVLSEDMYEQALTNLRQANKVVNLQASVSNIDISCL